MDLAKMIWDTLAEQNKMRDGIAENEKEKDVQGNK